MSLSLFWQSLLSHLPNVTPLDVADAANLVIHPDNALAMTFTKPMEQFAGIVHPSVGDYAGVVGGLVGGLVKKVVLPASVRARAKVAAQQKSWQGDYQANPDIPHVTRTATTKVDLTRLVQLAKKNAVSVHALIHVAFLAAWAEQYKNRGVAMSTPVNCRSHATDQDLSKTLGNFVGVVSRSWSAAELQKMSSATSSFWQAVTLYHQHLQKGKQRSVVQVQFLNLLDYPHGYINDYWLDMRKKYEMKRQGGMEHSDLGRFPAPAPIDDADNVPWQLRDLWFQQSTQTFTTALGMQTITLGATLHAAFCWQKGALDEPLVQAVVDRFKAILDDLAA
ncbi:hypothetical protein BC940DRAFT_245828 [Gongronella butleri]|nr:hypothetical protein BC940DRAFT_245828 [Gongronella butleri]